MIIVYAPRDDITIKLGHLFLSHLILNLVVVGGGGVFWNVNELVKFKEISVLHISRPHAALTIYILRYDDNHNHDNHNGAANCNYLVHCVCVRACVLKKSNTVTMLMLVNILSPWIFVLWRWPGKFKNVRRVYLFIEQYIIMFHSINQMNVP